MSAIKAGGADASVNGRLAAAMSKAKHAMMPKDSVDVAVKKVRTSIWLGHHAATNSYVDCLQRQRQNRPLIILRMSFTKAMALVV